MNPKPNNKIKHSLFSIKLIAFLLFILTLISSLSLPYFASTSWGNTQILKRLNSKSKQTIKAEKITFSWLGPQIASHVEINNSLNHSQLSFEKGTLNCSLFKLLWKRIPEGNLTLSSLQATFFKKSQDQREDLTLELKDVNAALAFESLEKPLILHLSGFTQQRDLSGKFDIDLEMAGLKLEKLLTFNQESFNLFQNSPEAQLKIKADVSNFPPALIDHALAHFRPELAGLAETLIGKSLNFSIDQRVSNEQINFTLQAQSSHLSAAMKANLTPKSFSLQEPGKISLKLTPEGISKIANTSFKWQLTQPVQTELTFDQFSLPLEYSPELKRSLINLDQMLFSVLLKLPQADFIQNSSNETISLRQCQALIEKKAGAKKFGVSLNGEAVQLEQLIDFKMTNMEWAFDDQLTLVQPAVLHANLSPSFFNRFFQFPVKLQSSTSLDFIFQRISLPFDVFFPETTIFQGEARFAPLSFSDIPKVNEVIVSNLKVEIGGNSLKDAKCSLKATLSQPNDQGHLVTILGPRTTLSTESNLTFSSKGEAIFKNFKAKLKSSLAAIDLEGELFDHREFFLTSPAMINYTLTPAAMDYFGLKKTYFLNKDTPLEITIQSPNKAVNLLDLRTVHLTGGIKIDELTLASKNELSASLQKLLLTWEVDGDKNQIRVGFDGDTHLGLKSYAGQINGSAIVKNWVKDNQLNLRQASFQLKTNLNKLPVALINPLATQIDLIPVLGSSIDLFAEANINFAQSKEGILKVRLNSDQIKGEAAFKLNHSLVLQSSDSPATIFFKLTPQGYLSIRNHLLKNSSQEIVLTEPAEVAIHLKSIHIPIQPDEDFVLPYWKGSLATEFTIDHLHAFSPKDGKRISIKGIKGNVTSDHLSEKILFALNAEESIDVIGSVENAFNSLGSFNHEGLSVAADAKVRDLPADLLCHLSCLDPKNGKKTQALFGDKLNGDIKVTLKQMNGPIYADLKGENGFLFLDGFLAKNYLTLTKPLNINVKVSPELGEYVLQDYFPFLAGLLSANQPLKITIEPKGFSLPVFPVNFTAAQMPKAIIDLGEVVFHQTSQLGTIVSLIAPLKSDHFSVQLTPIYFSYLDGILKLERVDMLLGKEYPIAAWGKINLIKEKVNMVIALSGLAISKAFNVHIADKNYFLQLPLKGTMKTATIDKSKATTRISALVAQSHGSPQGFVIGTFLDIASGALGEEKAPPPTMKPLPWSALFEKDASVPTETEADPK